MNTMRADYRTDIVRLAEDMAKRDAALSDRIATSAERMATASDRAATARWWQTGALLAAIAIATAIALAAPVD